MSNGLALRKKEKKKKKPTSTTEPCMITEISALKAAAAVQGEGKNRQVSSHQRHTPGIQSREKGRFTLTAHPVHPLPLRPASTTRTRRDASRGPRLKAVPTNPRLANDCTPLSDTHFRSRQTCPVVVSH